ncbi:putative transcription factor C2H2 family [Helianthus annuus]|uniref:RING-type E3 ubiquitin transferase n=1 Tax=Helianthus annuus TaxID=4232 RepID=A0A251SDV6_HELAN|nr:RING finger protein 44 [Helianthus annuus]KAF5766577.1 putative transcription factor C2H2 family [Helianthus annuus]KAJ0452938.1 putative transcription factor C2H2 family [Helianthus annuus]KAJ0474853.1 putative transcription factor C2H2 family [Helianthus annuus]KAJ0650409.1 putative transcription factor C2H2 family [Helianthus annuus]KAJ0654172.1 putative transcription factor C2H2 family [Helianthus annuus]
MRQRNMAYTGQMIDNEIEHAHLHPEPCVIPYGHGPMSSGITFMAAAPPGPRVVPFGPHNPLPFPSHQLMDDAFKGKISEGLHVSSQYSYPAPSSNPFVVPEYIGFNVIPVVMGPGHHRGARTRAAGAVDLNPGVQFMPMSHGAIGQPVQVVPGPWLDQQFCGNVPGMPYMQGYTNGGPVAFMHQPLPPMPPLQPMLPRFARPVPPTVDRVYPPHGQQLVIESNSRQRGLRALPEAEVAMLNFGNYGHRVDHHRDMRLDIDHMSYEELVALGEQIGNAGSGLSKDFILGHLKMRIFTASNLQDTPSTDQNLSFCTICQMDYNDEEKIGMLDCSHEYHVDCIEKWLVEKNSCPVCKCTGLAAQGKES